MRPDRAELLIVLIAESRTVDLASLVRLCIAACISRERTWELLHRHLRREFAASVLGTTVDLHGLHSVADTRARAPELYAIAFEPGALKRRIVGQNGLRCPLKAALLCALRDRTNGRDDARGFRALCCFVRWWNRVGHSIELQAPPYRPGEITDDPRYQIAIHGQTASLQALYRVRTLNRSLRTSFGRTNSNGERISPSRERS